MNIVRKYTIGSLFVLILGVFLFASAGLASAADFYVATTGNDSVSCGTAANITTPKKTINGGLGCLQAGDALYVRAGTYAEELSTYNGNIHGGTSWSNAVTISAYPGETVIIKPNIGANRAITLASASASFLIFNGFIFDASNVAYDAVKITWSGTVATDASAYSHHIRIQNSEIKNSPGNGILTTGIYANYNEFINLDVHDNGTTDYDHGFYISTSNNFVEKSKVYKNAGWGIHVYNGDPGQTANNNIIRNNQSFNNARAGNRGVGIGLYSGTGNVAYNNLVWGNNLGVAVNYGAMNSLVYNNTVYANNNGSTPNWEGINIGSEAMSSVVQNNIVYQNNGGGIVNAGSGTVTDHNLINIDPKFVNAAGSDFHLQSGSPAIDAGIAVSTVTTDFDGISRPQGTAYDIGAYEYVLTKSVSYYQTIYDSQYEANKSTLDSLASSGNGETYYTFQYAFGGTLSMYEATKDIKYLERALAWANTMMSKATIVDINGNLNWSGPWLSPYSSTTISYQLDDLQGSTELARLARIILTDPVLTNTYGAQALTVRDFVKKQIVDKWLYVRNSESWFIYNSTTNTIWYNDKCALLVRLLTNLYRSGDTSYVTLTATMVNGFKNRLVAFTSNSLIWDLGLNPDLSGHAIDTSHANRYPDMVIDAVNAGIGSLTKTDLTGLSNLLSAVIWDQSLSSPRFTNYIDGNNDPYGTRPAWNDGLIYSGWVKLAEYDPKVLMLADATLKAIMAGVSNPSLDYNNTFHGRIALSGHLAKAVAGIKDITSPSVSLTAPASGAIVSGTITVSASASDNVGVSGVQFKLDGANLGAEVITAPYSVSWNTTAVANGSHILTAVARDAAGNAATSVAVSVTVNNFDTASPSIPTGLTATAISSSQINLSWTASTDNVGVAGYKVYRNGTQIATVTTTAYSNTGLSAATAYTYTVSAYDAAGNNSLQSSSASATTQPASTQKFQIGDRVKTTAILNVRSKPQTGRSSKVLGTQPLGAFGTVIGGPGTGSGYTWWNINYDNPPDGWSVQNYLEKVITASGSLPAVTAESAPVLTAEERTRRIAEIQSQIHILQLQLASLLDVLRR